MLNPTQEKAQALTRELHLRGAQVVSPQGYDFLKFQMEDARAEPVLEWLRNLGWAPTCRGNVPRFHGMEPVSLYELVLREIQPITPSIEANRAIPGSVASGKKNENSEAYKIAKDLGYK